jgi:hypothetical protein
MPSAKTSGNGKKRNPGFLRHHSLSLAAVSVVSLWTILYYVSDPQKHWGSFFGNAIADWIGVVVTVIATKYLYEKGSSESRKPPREPKNRVHRLLRDHSLVVFLLISGTGWVLLYLRLDPGAKWGQVVGNIVSEWTQLLGLVLLTKRLVEQHSKEGAKK